MIKTVAATVFIYFSTMGTAYADDLDSLDELDNLEDGGSSGASGPEILKGFASNESRYFFRDRDEGSTDEASIFELQFETEYNLGSARLFLRPWFLVDTVDSDLQRYEPLEGYIDWRGESWDFRAGQFIENWGIADTFNPLDVLNRNDIGVDLLAPQKLGEAGFRWRYHGDDGYVFGQPVLALYLMPVFRETAFPTDESRYSLSQSGAVLREGDAVTPEGEAAVFAAFRFGHTVHSGLMNGDFQYIAARGPDKTPTLVTGLDAAGPYQVPEYFGTEVVGGGFRAIPNGEWWSKLTLKTEVVHKKPYAINGMTASLPDDYTQYVVGLDRLVAPFMGDKDQLTMTLEYVGEDGTDDVTAGFRPFRSDAVLRLFWEAGNFARSSVEFISIWDVKNKESITELEYKSQLRWVHDDLSLSVLAQMIEPAKSESTFFTSFSNNSNGRLRLQYDF